MGYFRARPSHTGNRWRFASRTGCRNGFCQRTAAVTAVNRQAGSPAREPEAHAAANTTAFRCEWRRSSLADSINAAQPTASADQSTTSADTAAVAAFTAAGADTTATVGTHTADAAATAGTHTTANPTAAAVSIAHGTEYR